MNIEIHCSCETDEFWSYVGCKSNQRWTWYAMDAVSGRILAWHNGKRKDEDFLKLLNPFPISMYYTDDWGSYRKYIPPQMHQVGKDNTWRIERKNLNFRTHIKLLNRKQYVFQKMKPFTTTLSECILVNSIIKQELMEIILKTANLGHDQFF